MRTTFWIAATCAFLLAGKASAQGTASDVRCLVVSNAYAKGANDPKAQEIAKSARLFYGGRLSMRDVGGIGRELAAQQKQITPANAGPIMNSCAQEMSRSLGALEAVGRPQQPGKK
jgi:hypothetical protein